MLLREGWEWIKISNGVRGGEEILSLLVGGRGIEKRQPIKDNDNYVVIRA